MSTYTQILYQIVFGSKNCIKFLNTTNQTELFNYIYGVVQNKKSVPYIVGGHSNHIHIIVSLHPTESLSGFIRDIKRASHNWMAEKKSYSNFFGWQVGYGGFTYNFTSKKNLIRYVENQAEHHKEIDFQDELVMILEEHGIEYDLKYLFI